MAEIVLNAKFLEKAIDAFRKMPLECNEAMRKVVKTSTRNIREYARANHRFKTDSGNLERSIESKFYEDPPAGLIYINTRTAAYGLYVHEGTRPHAIFPKEKRVLRWVGQGGDFVFARNVRHPGTEPDKFLPEALAAKTPDVERMFVNAVRRVIRKARG